MVETAALARTSRTTINQEESAVLSTDDDRDMSSMRFDSLKCQESPGMRAFLCLDVCLDRDIRSTYVSVALV